MKICAFNFLSFAQMNVLICFQIIVERIFQQILENNAVGRCLIFE